MADPQALLVAVAAGARRSSTSGCPRRSSTSARRPSTWRRRRRATARRWRSGTRGRTCRTVPSARCRRTSAGRATRVRNRSATGPATSTLMTIDGGWVAQQYLPDELTDRRGTTNRANTGTSRRSRAEWMSTNHDRGRTRRRSRRGAVLPRVHGAVVVLVRVLDSLQLLRREIVSLREETGPLLDELRSIHRRRRVRPSTKPATTSIGSIA